MTRENEENLIQKHEEQDSELLKKFISQFAKDAQVTTTPKGWHFDAYMTCHGKKHKIETKQLNCGYQTYQQWVLNWKKTIPVGKEEKDQNADIFIEFFNDDYVTVTTMRMIHQMYHNEDEIECMWLKEVPSLQVNKEKGSEIQKQYVFRHSHKRNFLNKYYRLYKWNGEEYERVN